MPFFGQNLDSYGGFRGMVVSAETMRIRCEVCGPRRGQLKLGFKNSHANEKRKRASSRARALPHSLSYLPPDPHTRRWECKGGRPSGAALVGHMVLVRSEGSPKVSGMVQGKIARRKELASGRRQDHKDEKSRKQAKASRATHEKVRARLIHFAGSDKEQRVAHIEAPD